MFGSNAATSFPGGSTTSNNRSTIMNTNQRFGTSPFHSMNSNGGNRSNNLQSNHQTGTTRLINNRNIPSSNHQQNNTNNSTVGLFTSVFTQTANIGDPSEDENQLNRQFVQSANLIAQFYTSSLLAYRKSYQQGVKKSFRRLSSLLLQYSNQQQTQNAQIPINLVLTMMNQVLQEELTATSQQQQQQHSPNNVATPPPMNTSAGDSSSMNGHSSPNQEQQHTIPCSTSPMSSLSVHNSIPSNGNSPQTNKNDDAMPSSPINSSMVNPDNSLLGLSTNMECTHTVSNCTTTSSNGSQQSTESTPPHPSSNVQRNTLTHTTASNNNSTIQQEEQHSKFDSAVSNASGLSTSANCPATTNQLHCTITPSNPFAFPFQFTSLPNLSSTNNPTNGGHSSGITVPFDFSATPTDYSFANALLSGGVTTQTYHHGGTLRSSNQQNHHPIHHKGSSQQHGNQRSFYSGSFSQNPLKRDIQMLNSSNSCDEDDEDDEAPTFLFRSINTTTSTAHTPNNSNNINNTFTTNNFLTENSSLSPPPFSEHHLPSSAQNNGDFSELSPLTQIFKKNRI